MKTIMAIQLLGWSVNEKCWIAKWYQFAEKVKRTNGKGEIGVENFE